MATLADWFRSHTDDYKQLAGAYPNANKFGAKLKDNISKNIPSNTDFQSPERMGEWSQAAALNAPMGLMFTGPKSTGWNTDAANTATKLLDNGADPSQVWKDHLIGRMPDGKLFSEIDDSGVNMLPIPKDDYSHNSYNVIDHNELLDNYPEMVNTRISKGASSYYSPEHDHIKISKINPLLIGNAQLDKAQNRVISLAERLDDKGMLTNARELKLSNIMDELYNKYPYAPDEQVFDKSIAIHELQHDVQNKEGWARGGSPEQMREEALAMLRRDVASGEIGSTEQAMDMLPMAQNNAYRRLTGEAQARATQDRMRLNMQQRRDTYPLAGDKLSDIPLSQLINRYR